jgi:hypothetical protein
MFKCLAVSPDSGILAVGGLREILDPKTREKRYKPSIQVFAKRVSGREPRYKRISRLTYTSKHLEEPITLTISADTRVLMCSCTTLVHAWRCPSRFTLKNRTEKYFQKDRNTESIRDKDSFFKKESLDIISKSKVLALSQKGKS